MVSIVDEIKTSCRRSLAVTQIKLDDDGIRSFLTQLDKDDFDKYSQEHGHKFPLQYRDALDELNFLSILTILNFLSAYRISLHKLTGAGAYDTIRRFMLSCYLSQLSDEGSAPLSAAGMVNMTEMEAAEYLKIPLLAEKKHPTLPGVHVGERDAEAVEIVGLVRGVMNETGRILQSLKQKSLGDWVAVTLSDASVTNLDQRLDYFVRQLVHTFPAFADEGDVKGYHVKLYKKAQLLAHIIGISFAGREDECPFPLPSIKGISACVDNVVPTMAVHFKLIGLSDCAYPIYRNGLGTASATGEKTQGISQSAEEAFAIRAAALTACERVVELAPEVADKTGKGWLRDITAMDVDGYLWMKAKDGDLRNLPRLSERGTVYY